MVEPFLNHTHSVWFSFYKKGAGLNSSSRPGKVARIEKSLV